MAEMIQLDRQALEPGMGRRLGPGSGGDTRPSDRDLYRDRFKKEMEGLIEAVALDDLPKRYLRSRWLDQLLWMDSRANQSRKLYYILQLVTIVGGVAIPPLVSHDMGTTRAAFAQWCAIGLGLVVAISVAVEGFFHFGDRWRQYRRDAELLKAEGWQFSQLSGPYRSAATHGEGYSAFVDRVEQILQKDVEAYFTQVVRSKKEEKSEAPAS
jgi:Protein of unknown function (DUF4231)